MDKSKLQLRSLGKGRYRLKIHTPDMKETRVVPKKDLSKRVTDKADAANGKYVDI